VCVLSTALPTANNYWSGQCVATLPYFTGLLTQVASIKTGFIQTDTRETERQERSWSMIVIISLPVAFAFHCISLVVVPPGVFGLAFFVKYVHWPLPNFKFLLLFSSQYLNTLHMFKYFCIHTFFAYFFFCCHICFCLTIQYDNSCKVEEET